MQELKLPHQDPIRFAKYIISKEDNRARVFVEFSSQPSFAMLIESAAQSCAALNLDGEKKGFLLALKGVKEYAKAKSLEYEVAVVKEYELSGMLYIGFKIYSNEILCVDGHLTVAIEE